MSLLYNDFSNIKWETFEETKQWLKKQFPNLTEKELINKTRNLISAIKKL